MGGAKWITESGDHERDLMRSGDPEYLHNSTYM